MNWITVTELRLILEMCLQIMSIVLLILGIIHAKEEPKSYFIAALLAAQAAQFWQ